MYWLMLILRWLHLVAAITAVGGTIFMRFALVPSVAILTEEQRQSLHGQIRSRWGKLVMASIGFLLISGLFNFGSFYINSKTDSWDTWRHSYNGLYQAVFGIKFMLAMAIFFIASALTGRAEALKSFRQNAKYWLTVNVILALTVVALSGVLRLTHTGPNMPVASSEGPALHAANAMMGDSHG